MPAQADLVHETSVSTGTGNFTTAAINGKQRFSDAGAFGTGATLNVFDYFISNRDAAEWERGTGHMSAVGTLVRDTVLAGSNGTSLVSFTAGTKDITNDVPATQQARIKVTTNGDSNFAMLSTDRIVATSAALTAARTWTLMAANSLPPGTLIEVCDFAGGITSANALSVARAGSDTINGQASSLVINAAYGSVQLQTDGASKWTIIRFRRARKVSIYTSGSGTHTTEIGCADMRVRLVGAGGGGEGSGGSPGAGGTGNSSTFGSSFLTATGGAGASGGTGGGGGGGTGGLGLPGGAGSAATLTTGQFAGGDGGNSVFGGGAGGAPPGAPGANGAANTGGGGGGGSVNGTTRCGAGGGAGGYVEAFIRNPSTSYAYAIGTGGTAGAAGSGGVAGGAGGSGIVIVEEDFA